MADILDYLAALLGGLIGVPASPSKGLLRLAIKDAYPDKEDISTLQISDIQSVFKTTLRDRLLRVRSTGVDEIVSKLDEVLTTNQSLLTMMRV